MEKFWEKYKVFILGLIGSVTLALQAVLSDNPNEVDYKIYAYAALMAALSYIATQWRGKAGTLAGVIGTLAGVFVTLNQGGTFTWNQFIIYAIIAVGMSFSPPPKPSTYEQDTTIVKAKEIPPVATTEDNSKLPIGGSGEATETK